MPYTLPIAQYHIMVITNKYKKQKQCWAWAGLVGWSGQAGWAGPAKRAGPGRSPASGRGPTAARAPPYGRRAGGGSPLPGGTAGRPSPSTGRGSAEGRSRRHIRTRRKARPPTARATAVAGGREQGYAYLKGSSSVFDIVLVENADGPGRLHHASLEVWPDEDFDLAEQKLKKRGIEIIRRLELPHKTSIVIRDPSGTPLEFFVRGRRDYSGLAQAAPGDRALFS